MHLIRTWAVAALATAALVTSGAGAASAAPDPSPQPGHGDGATRPTPPPGMPTMGRDNRPSKYHDALVSQRKDAVAAYVDGRAKLVTKGGGEAIAYQAPGAQKVSYVQFSSTRTEKVWSILAEFSGAGPLHNSIPRPDDGDNFTHWVKNFDKAYFERMLSSDPAGNFTDYYKKQSGGKFTAVHTVEDWVKVPQPESFYGKAVRDEQGNLVTEDADPEAFIKDTLEAWAKGRRSAGWSNQQINDYVKKLDVWDRYDQDGDGNFNEPDGYIDHFQAVHAGEGEEAGGGDQGEDAIWSHRWSAYMGDSGPAAYDKKGGVRIPGTDVWVLDYTVEPENGGLGVFVHEFGHDLGLSDYYNTGGSGDNATGAWTLMSNGSWMSKGKDNPRTADRRVGVGTNPGNLSAHEKLLLGWSQVLRQRWYPGTTVTTKLSGSGQAVAGANQAVAVTLPRAVVKTPTTKPFKGSWMYWTGNTANLRSWLQTGDVTVGASGLRVSALVAGNAETDYDVAYMRYLDPNTGRWESCVSTVDPTRPMSLTGPVGSAPMRGDIPTTPVAVHWSVPSASPNGASLVGKKVRLGVEYVTDVAVSSGGYYFDDLTVSGATVPADGGETTTGSWSSFTPAKSTTKMTRVGASGFVQSHANRYYLMENRLWNGYDANLRTGPYTGMGRLEFYPYNTGMLVWYVDDQFLDNNRPGQGFALPVDANPPTGNVKKDLVWTFPDGSTYYGDTNMQSSDSTFKAPGQKYEALSLNLLKVPARPAVSTFSDRSTTAYYKTLPDDPMSAYWSVKTPHSGLTASVLSQDAAGTLSVKIAVPQNFTGQWK